MHLLQKKLKMRERERERFIKSFPQMDHSHELQQENMNIVMNHDTKKEKSIHSIIVHI